MVTTRSRRKEEPRDRDFLETATKRVKVENSSSNRNNVDDENISRTLTDPNWRQKSNEYDKQTGRCEKKHEFTNQVNNFIAGSNNYLLMSQQRRCRNMNLANIRRGTGYRATINL